MSPDGSRPLAAGSGRPSVTYERLTALGPRVVDVGLLLGVGLLLVFDVAFGGAGTTDRTLAKVAAGLGALLAVALRRRFPLATMLAMVAAVLLPSLERGTSPGLGSFYWYPAFAPVAALGALATPVVRRQSAPVATAAVAAGAVAVGSLLAWPNDDSELILFVVLFGGTYVIGVGAGVYLRDLDRQQRLAASRARADERLDLARELHDLVAHYVTGIVVQAQAAQVVADRDPSAAGTALDRIEEAGKDALTAMRRLVGSLRDDDALPTAPPVGLAGLADLVAPDGAPGPAVVVTIDPAADLAVPGAVAASVHRIVQESVTNARRHGVDATRVEVDVLLADRALAVTVTDDGRPLLAGRWVEGQGYGLIGMQERAQALGGTLTAGPVDPPGHGWQVRATLPLLDAGGLAS